MLKEHSDAIIPKLLATWNHAEVVGCEAMSKKHSKGLSFINHAPILIITTLALQQRTLRKKTRKEKQKQKE